MNAGEDHLHTHLLSQIVVHLQGHGDPLVVVYDVVLEGMHGLHNVAGVGF